MAEGLHLNFTNINAVLGEDIENIFPHRYNPLAPILAGSLMSLTVLAWLIHKHRNFLSTKFSYYHILCFKFCTWKGSHGGDCGSESDWSRTRRHVGVSASTTSTNRSLPDVSSLAGVLSRLQNIKPPDSPPPPYEHPPSYSIAVIMASNDAYIVSDPVLV